MLRPIMSVVDVEISLFLFLTYYRAIAHHDELKKDKELYLEFQILHAKLS